MRVVGGRSSSSAGRRKGRNAGPEGRRTQSTHGPAGDFVDRACGMTVFTVRYSHSRILQLYSFSIEVVHDKVHEVVRKSRSSSRQSSRSSSGGAEGVHGKVHEVVYRTDHRATGRTVPLHPASRIPHPDSQCPMTTNHSHPIHGHDTWKTTGIRGVSASQRRTPNRNFWPPAGLSRRSQSSPASIRSDEIM
jgi:hypothetical protein